MKKASITVLLVVATITAFSQTTVTSKALGDLIILPKSAFEITPIIVTAKGDTARSMSWYATSMLRDTTVAFNTVIQLYSKSGIQLTTDTQVIPGNVYAKWAGLINKIDAYILNQRKRLVKQ